MSELPFESVRASGPEKRMSIAQFILNLPSARLQRLAIRASARLHMHSGTMPHFIVLGAQKAGTTSLHAYLGRHPQVLPGATKEIHYFDLNYAKGPEWYRRQFISAPATGAATPRRSISGEASPYYLFHPLAASRIAETVPSARLIALLRNPVARAYSHYQHNRRKRKEQLSFSGAIAREIEMGGRSEDDLRTGDSDRNRIHQDFSYLARGRYAEQLERFFFEFPRDQMLILKSEDLFQNPHVALSQVVRFLGLDELPGSNFNVRNAGNYNRREIPQEAFLREYFAPHNSHLYELIGRDLGW